MIESTRRKCRELVLIGLAMTTTAAFAQDATAPPQDAAPQYRLGLEVKTHFRSSDFAQFPIPAAISEFLRSMDLLPPGQDQAFMATVEDGDHAEVSMVRLEGSARWSEDLEAQVTIDFIDRYDRNPTSTDREIDIDEAWIRFGREAEVAEPPEKRGWYAKLGKFPKFERQDDRHLESYGLVTTSFNRLEDVGLELGFDLTRHLYLKASFTQGNPLFFRDPNALAGDNGTVDLSVRNPVPELQTGLPILYDADVDKVDFEHPEVGAGLGFRWSSPTGFTAFDVLVWGYERELAAEAPLDNTFYGGDLDLIDGPLNSTPPPDLDGDTKEEIGANLWLYAGHFSLFAQYVDQSIAGLDRTGFEVEAAWSFDLPLVWAARGRQIFPWIAPSIRFSELDNDFRIDPSFPAPSAVWDWEKLDVGLRVAVIDELDVTFEWQDNTFIRAGREESNDEFLVTLALALERSWPR